MGCYQHDYLITSLTALPRSHADLTELTLPSNIKIVFPEGKDKPMHFEITIKADEGMYRYVWWVC